MPGRQRLHQPSGVGLRDDELGRDLDRRGDLLHDRGGRHRRRRTNQLRRVLQHDDLDKIKCQHYLFMKKIKSLYLSHNFVFYNRNIFLLYSGIPNFLSFEFII